MKIGDFVAFLLEIFFEECQLCGFSRTVDTGKGDKFHGFLIKIMFGHVLPL